MSSNNKAMRREARESVFCLLYESEFHTDRSAEEIFETAVQSREINCEDEYVKAVYFGIAEKQDMVDEIIARHAKGWRTGRLSRVSRAILRLAVYEMGYMKDIPNTVSINEAIELSKKYGEPAAKGFINGVLNAVKDELSGAKPTEKANADD